MTKQATMTKESRMIQEYLFLSDERIEEIKKYHVKDALETYTHIKNTECWIVSFSLKGDSMDNAKALSNANDYIIGEYKPKVVTNGCAAYFTKRLYPLAVDFERGLRKLLYLKAAVSKSRAAEKNIQNLEERNLDDIKYILFYDKAFYESVNATITQNRRFRKEDIQHLVDSIEEKTVWQALFPDNPPEHLKEKFSTLMTYRNDIMHSHNINYEQYETIKSSFELVNGEISTAISTMVAQKFDTENAIEFDQSLGEAIQAQSEEYEKASMANIITLLTSYMNSPAVEDARKIAANNNFGIMAASLEAMMQHNKIYETLNSPEYQKMISDYAKIMEQLSAMHSNNSVQRAINQLNDRLNKNDGSDEGSNEKTVSPEEAEGEQK